MATGYFKNQMKPKADRSWKLKRNGVPFQRFF